jgi:hypothetical protein
MALLEFQGFLLFRESLPLSNKRSLSSLASSARGRLGSKLSTADRFCPFDDDIEALNLRAVSRPQAILVRLFRAPVAGMSVRFDSFPGALQKSFSAMSGTIQTFYMCKQDPDCNFSAAEIHDFAGNYPRHTTIY